MYHLLIENRVMNTHGIFLQCSSWIRMLSANRLCGWSELNTYSYSKCQYSLSHFSYSQGFQSMILQSRGYRHSWWKCEILRICCKMWQIRASLLWMKWDEVWIIESWWLTCASTDKMDSNFYLRCIGNHNCSVWGTDKYKGKCLNQTWYKSSSDLTRTLYQGICILRNSFAWADLHSGCVPQRCQTTADGRIGENHASTHHTISPLG